MSQFQSKYSIELVNSAGTLLADLTGRAMHRRIILSRNEAEDITWRLDLNEFEKYCRDTNQDPRNLLINGSTEVRIKRGQSYLCGGQLNYFTPYVSPKQQYIDIKASGFLNLFQDRFTAASRIFTATQATTIASTVINETQAQTNGDYGVTIGSLATVGLHDRTYQRTNLKNLLQDLTRVQTASFDFQFAYNKVFNTFAQLGSQRPDVIFEYPKNITSFSVPNDATGLANHIIALGSGFGQQAQTQAVVDNTSSQTTYKLREKVITPNGVIDVSTLTDVANAELAAWAFPFELPSITVDGNQAPFVTDYGIGDQVRIRIKNYKMLSHIDGLYRIEKIDLQIDDDDNETINLFVS